MNAFAITNPIGARGVRRIQRMLGDRGIRSYLIGENRLSVEEEITLGDLLVVDPGAASRTRTLEVKTEQRWTGNLFLETWSHKRAGRPGWMETGDFDQIAFYFEDYERVYVFDFQALKAWANGPSRLGYRRRRVEDFPSREQRKYEQRNDTWGHLVPVSAPDLPRADIYERGALLNGQRDLFIMSIALLAVLSALACLP